MSFRRLAATFDVEFRHSFRRPLFIILALIILLTSWGLSTGGLSISSGDSSVGGTKAWITSEFAQTQMMTYLTLLYFAVFVAAAAGLTLLHDRETKADVILGSTPLTAGEYVWGRFLAVMATFLLLLLWQAITAALFNHAIPNGAAKEIRGPFAWGHYLRPALLIGVPFLLFFGGLSMLIGEKTRNAVLVYLAPIAALLFCGFFLWTWSPSWLDFRVNQLLQVIEPSGFRWLNETYLKVDKGVQFYNTRSVPYDALFWLNRLWLIVLGLGSVFLTQRSVARSLRGAESARERKKATRRSALVPTPWEEAPSRTPIQGLGMASGSPSFFGAVGAVAWTELRELLRQAGLYFFIPIILIQILGNTLLAIGAFDTPILLTPGTTAVSVAGQVTTYVCLLLLFYTVESLQREQATGIASMLYAAPFKTGAFLLGKALANSVVGATVLMASLAACWLAIQIQHTVSFTLGPYILVWGLLILPTFLVWTAFVTAAYAAVGSRYGAYAISLAALAYTGYRALSQKLSWAGNWPLWGVLRWSDLGAFERDRGALILNRLMVLGAALFFTALAMRLFRRRGADAVRTLHRLQPKQLMRSAVRLAPFAVVPLCLWATLLFQVSQGPGGGAAKKERKDYWAKNLKTWLDAPLPDIARADVALKIYPAKNRLESRGTFALVNGLDTTLAQIPLTGGLEWEHLSWTMNGKGYKPEDSKRLYVFTPPRPLAKGDSVVIGWNFAARLPAGISKNGGNIEEFVLPSGVVLTGFTPSFMPVLGFMEDVGETKENKTEPRRYPRDYWKGMTQAGNGATAWFPARIAVTGPAGYTLNSVGVCTSDTVANGWRTQVWESDHPVKILNVICGRWQVKQGHGTAIYYNPAHATNVAQMSATLDAARRWYSEWFQPYPWRDLKLSEFPGLAGYAQGFGTNITFSENIGFLTRNDAKTNATFLVTAHEAAHQWWGNIVTPAKGPGADFLSEAMAHFSTLLLFDKVLGPRERMEFAKGLEARYGDRRRVDDERAMYDVDGKREADETVIYDRGGWVFWMLYDYLGHDQALAGYREFFRTWSVSRDHPALQDLIAAMRPYAADSAAYDAFVKQWFEDRVVPQYQITGAAETKQGVEYEVTATVRNAGTGTMPVEIAATAGERWAKPSNLGKGVVPAGAVDWSRSRQDPAYREARTTIALAAGESKRVSIRCPFKPDKVVVDPDVRILQLRRKQAVASL
ncbi:MAG TPA: M1 family aminopeptidase [Candidatus Limnocylindrales bacterium]|nr:M1 family aminopeptidase [Candidatus Limnocylindrales bacterium]